MHERLARAHAIVRDGGPITAYEVAPLLHGEPITPLTASWRMQETLCHLRHLEVTGALARDGSEPERWRSTASAASA